MTKFEWERQLKKGISGLPDSEQQRVLDYYGELFSDKIDAGMSEKEIVAEFGNPYDVANKILVDFYNDGKNNPKADEYIYSSPDSIDDNDEEATAAAQPTAVPVNVENEKAVRKSEKPRQQSGGSGAKSEKGKKHKVKVEFHSRKGRQSFGGMVVLICTLMFFVLGAFFGLWHPAWMVFLLIPVVISLIEAIEKRNWHIFCYPVLVVIIYLLCGFYGRLWHPMWVLFITIPLYYTIGSYISKNVDSDGEDADDDDDGDENGDKKPSNKGASSQSASANNKSANGSSNGSAKSSNGASQDKGTNVGRVIAGVLLTIILVYVMIVVWSAVIGLFCAGLGMICGGLMVLVSSFASFVADVYLGILMLGAALVLVGLGLVFTFGMASVFKYCVKMCKQFGKTISACFDAKE